MRKLESILRGNARPRARRSATWPAAALVALAIVFLAAPSSALAGCWAWNEVDGCTQTAACYSGSAGGTCWIRTKTTAGWVDDLVSWDNNGNVFWN